jgi:hypothetical protein
MYPSASIPIQLSFTWVNNLNESGRPMESMEILTKGDSFKTKLVFSSVHEEKLKIKPSHTKRCGLSLFIKLLSGLKSL